MVTKFLDLLYHSIVPRKPEAPVEPGARYDVHYQKPLKDSLTGVSSVGKYMSREFNDYSSVAGAQVTVMIDPNDWKRQFAIKNVSDHDIKVDYHNGTNKILAPGEMEVFKINYQVDDPWYGIPRLTALPNGNR